MPPARRALLALAALALAAPLVAATIHEQGRFPIEGRDGYKPQLWCFWAFDEEPTPEERDCTFNATAESVDTLRVRIVGEAEVFAKLDRQILFRGNLTWEQLALVECETSVRATCDAPLLGNRPYKELFKLFVRIEHVVPPAIVEVEAMQPDRSLPPLP